MNKPNGYDEAQGFQEFKRLPKGGYICTIKKMEEAISQNGNEMIVVYLDIADGEFKGYFADQYRNDTRPERKWGCVYRQVILDTTTQKTNSGFKGFMTSVEESNAGFVADKVWGADFVKFFKDKLIGCIFADEHYLNNNGEERINAKPNRVCSIQKIKSGDFKVPEDIYSKGTAPKKHNAIPDVAAGMGFTDMPDDEDDLPF